jgi:hypothetical protein
MQQHDPSQAQACTQTPTAQGLYDPANEHDACGVGFVAHIKGQKAHSIVEQGLRSWRTSTTAARWVPTS